ncbi:hypothetical protein GQ457_17G000890 [Hibiscus cannabinus]
MFTRMWFIVAMFKWECKIPFAFRKQKGKSQDGYTKEDTGVGTVSVPVAVKAKANHEKGSTDHSIRECKLIDSGQGNDNGSTDHSIR